VNRVAITLAKHFEGFRSKPYLCSAGVATIGYGTTHYPTGEKVTLKDLPIDKGIAESLLEREMSRCVNAAARHCPVLLTEDEKLGAIADFCYNLGSGRLKASTLRRRINQRDWHEVIYELKKWVRGGGRVLPGLVRRRNMEAKFFE